MLALPACRNSRQASWPHSLGEGKDQITVIRSQPPVYQRQATMAYLSFKANAQEREHVIEWRVTYAGDLAANHTPTPVRAPIIQSIHATPATVT